MSARSSPTRGNVRAEYPGFFCTVEHRFSISLTKGPFE
jgi:hypothetical protein